MNYFLLTVIIANVLYFLVRGDYILFMKKKDGMYRHNKCVITSRYIGYAEKHGHYLVAGYPGRVGMILLNPGKVKHIVPNKYGSFAWGQEVKVKGTLIQVGNDLVLYKIKAISVTDKKLTQRYLNRALTTCTIITILLEVIVCILLMMLK